MLNTVKRSRKPAAPTETAPPRRERLDLIEERVLRMRYGSVPVGSAQLGRKTEDPVLLADLERLERALIQRLRSPGSARKAAAHAKAAPKRQRRSARS